MSVSIAFGVAAALLAAAVIEANAAKPAPKSETAEPQIVYMNPPELGFFSKKLDCHGIPIKAHADVDDRALTEASRRIWQQIGSSPGIAHNLVQVGAEMHIIGKNQVTSDLPYFRHLKGAHYDGEKTIDERTRGVGGLNASCGEENLLKLPDDRYLGRDICSHEFAHTILSYGADEAMCKLVESRYEEAVKEGKWKTAYAGSNYHEYLAELTMWYFDTRGDFGQIEPAPESGSAWLRSYDPKGYEMVDRIYSGRQKVKKIKYVPLVAIPGKEESHTRSAESSDAVTIILDNQSKRDVQIFWLDQEGKRQNPRTLHAGDKDGIDTFAGHAWLITDMDGKAIRIYVAQKTPGRAVLQ